MSTRDDTILQGWLYKKGSLIKTWKKRWIVIDNNNMLKYYEDENCMKLKGQYDIDSHTVLYVTAADQYNKKKRFCIETSSSRRLELEANSESERELWMIGIQEKVNALKSNRETLGEVPRESIDILQNGWLEKQGSTVKTWKKRWIVLGEGCLFYYEDSSMDKMKGKMIFDETSRVYIIKSNENDDEKTLSWKFGISTQSRVLLLSAPSEEIRHNWVESTLSAVRKISLLPDFVVNIATESDVKLIQEWETSVFAASKFTEHQDESSELALKDDPEKGVLNILDENGNVIPTFLPLTYWKEIFEPQIVAAAKAEKEKKEKEKKEKEKKDNEKKTKAAKKEEKEKEEQMSKPKTKREAAMDRLKQRIVETMIKDITHSATLKVCKLVTEGMYLVVSRAEKQLRNQPLFVPKRGRCVDNNEDDSIDHVEIPLPVRNRIASVLNAVGGLLLSFRFHTEKSSSCTAFIRQLAVSRVVTTLLAAKQCIDGQVELLSLVAGEEVNDQASKFLNEKKSSFMEKEAKAKEVVTTIHSKKEELQSIQHDHEYVKDDVKNFVSSIKDSQESTGKDLVQKLSSGINVDDKDPQVGASVALLQTIIREISTKAMQSNSLSSSLPIEMFKKKSPVPINESAGGMAMELVEVLEGAVKSFVESKFDELQAMLTKGIGDIVNMMSRDIHSPSDKLSNAQEAFDKLHDCHSHKRLDNSEQEKRSMEMALLNQAQDSFEKLQKTVSECASSGLFTLWGIASKKSSDEADSDIDDVIVGDIDLSKE